MANLTISVRDELLRRARQRALEQGTSVDALLRSYLEAYAGEDPSREAIEAFLAFARTRTGPAEGGRTWTRDELRER